MNEYCYKCGGVHPPMGIAGCPGQSLVEAFPDPRDATLAALREENALLREVLSYARAILPMEKWADDTKGMIDAALASARPATAQEEGWDWKDRFAIEWAIQYIERTSDMTRKPEKADLLSALRALLARKPEAQEQGADKSTEAALREALDDCVAAYYLPGDHCEMEQAIERARALLARKPAEEAKPPSGMMSGGIQPCAEVEARVKP